MKQEHSAGIITYYEDFVNNQLHRWYLVLHYRKGHWDLPKGKLEGSETNKEAAIRELKEETGLTAELRPGFEQAITYIFKDQAGELVNKTVTYFIGQVFTKEVSLSSEHLYYKWLPARDAIKHLTYTNAQQILNVADKFITASLGG